MSKKASKKFPLLLTIVLSVLFLVIGFVGGVDGTYVIDKNTNPIFVSDVYNSGDLSIHF